MENVSPKVDFLFLGDQTYFKAKLNVPVYYHAKGSFRHLYTSPAYRNSPRVSSLQPGTRMGQWDSTRRRRHYLSTFSLPIWKTKHYRPWTKVPRRWEGLRWCGIYMHFMDNQIQ